MKRQDAPQRLERLLVRDAPGMSLCVRWMPNRRSSTDVPSTAQAEWAGRVGHPSSYGLLGGTRAIGEARLAVSPSNATYRQSLAGRGDTVRWGLPEEYQGPVLDALRQQPVLLLVSTAAHGEVGSSEHVFRGLAALLARVITAGVPADDEELWRWRDACWNGQ